MEPQHRTSPADEGASVDGSAAWQNNSRLSPSAHGMAESTASRRRNDESWVEIASQPSSSSLSSIGDEIVTTGLRVGGASYPPRRRRPHQPHLNPHQRQPTSMPQSYMVSRHGHGGESSSYEETESEEDTNDSRLSTANNAVMSNGSPQPLQDGDNDGDYDDSDDGNSTALGRPSASPVFRPEPNAFSHPPSHLTHRHSTPASMSGDRYLPFGSSHHARRRSSYSRQRNQPPHFMSPAYQEDNDEALRASLTTLLSCAAAVRGSPMRNELAIGGPSTTATALQPMGLRLASEAELMSETPPPAGPLAGGVAPSSAEAGKFGAATSAGAGAASASQSTSASPSPPSSTREEKNKRTAASGAQRGGGNSRAAKKKRTSYQSDGTTTAAASNMLISPTMLTWVVSAGVVVLVCAGFGAGFVIGRDVGRQEGTAAATAAAVNTTGSCGREIARSTTSGTLRRFRWGSMARSVAA